jgi:type VI secretion system protein ImpK
MTTTLRDLAADLFAMVFAFRAANGEERPAKYPRFRNDVEERLRKFRRNASEAGLDPQGDALRALVALVDDVCMNSDWPGRSEWQQDPIGDHDEFRFPNAGSGFFERVESLLGGGEDDVLDIHFTCLCAGFEGAHRDNKSQLAAVRESLWNRLSVAQAFDELRFALNADSPPWRFDPDSRPLPWAWVLAAVGIVLAVWGFSKWTLHQDLRSLEKVPAGLEQPV